MTEALEHACRAAYAVTGPQEKGWTHGNYDALGEAAKEVVDTMIRAAISTALEPTPELVEVMAKAGMQALCNDQEHHDYLDEAAQSMLTAQRKHLLGEP